MLIAVSLLIVGFAAISLWLWQRRRIALKSWLASAVLVDDGITRPVGRLAAASRRRAGRHRLAAGRRLARLRCRSSSPRLDQRSGARGLARLGVGAAAREAARRRGRLGSARAVLRVHGQRVGGRRCAAEGRRARSRRADAACSRGRRAPRSSSALMRFRLPAEGPTRW